MARCIVTGHKGFIGSQLFKRLQELGHEVLGIDLKEEYPKDILKNLKEYSDSSSRFHPTYQNFKPEYIFHLACFPRVGYSVENPVKTMKNNVLSTSLVLNFARKLNVKRVIFSSSSSVIGNGFGPESPYALQKFISEQECKLYSKLYGVDTVSLRYFNVYSADQTPDGPYSTAICAWMEAIRQGTRPFITGDGEQRRDMLHVSDAVEANICAMQHSGAFNGQVYDVGTGDNISLNEVQQIVHSTHPHVEFDYVKEREGDVRETRAIINNFKNDTSWSPKVSIRDGVGWCFEGMKK